MKIVKKSLRLWISFASVITFLTGWVLFSHANKPAPLISSQPATSSVISNQPARSSRNSFSSGGFSFPQQNLSTFSRPLLRTGGS